MTDPKVQGDSVMEDLVQPNPKRDRSRSCLSCCCLHCCRWQWLVWHTRVEIAIPRQTPPVTLAGLAHCC